MALRSLLLYVAVAAAVTSTSQTSAFVPVPSTKGSFQVNHPQTSPEDVSSSKLVVLHENKKKGGFDGNMRNKLVTESIAPWRTLRLFLYGAFGSGAFLGGLINISGAVAASNSPDFNLNTEVGEHDLWTMAVYVTMANS